MSTFTNSIPAASNLPSQDQPLMLGNNQYLQSFGSRDHQFTTSTANGNDGIHKQVTLGNEAAPGFSGGNSVVYANTDGSNSQLFFQNAAISAQLTTFKSTVPTNAKKGISCLPGKMVIIWNQETLNDGQTVDFSSLITLSGNCYVVIPSFAQSGQRGFLTVTAQSTIGFTLQIKDTSSNIFNNVLINWIAIGPA